MNNELRRAQNEPSDAAPVYEQLEAEKYIADRTGQTPETVRVFLETLWEFDEGQPAVDNTQALLYICGAAGLSKPAVASMYAEDVGYMVTRGIMDAGAYPYFRAWADDIATQEREAEENAPVN